MDNRYSALVSQISTSGFSLFGVSASSFHSPSSLVCYPFSFMSSFNIAPPQFWSSYFSVYPHFHHPCSHYYIFSLSLFFLFMFATPVLVLISSFLIFSFFFIPIIHLSIFICGHSCGHSCKSCSACEANMFGN